MNGFTVVSLVVLVNALLLLNYAAADQRKPDVKLSAIGELESFDEKPAFEGLFDGLDGIRMRRAAPESQEHHDNQQPPGGGGRRQVYAAIRNRRSAQGQGQDNGGQGQGQGGQDGQRGPPEGKGQGRGQGRSRN
ncbi:uncharacterized protein LOC126575723 [Anopheles aquasalis]|uniref:Putative secreted protein n=1 Tax=Anopheles aquasalis TaxID=42839 RepID=T1E7W3_ANOAQ|nr:uncharacterized protein LOC126575723 [Anopheles aquasalis]